MSTLMQTFPGGKFSPLQMRRVNRSLICAITAVLNRHFGGSCLNGSLV
jgi:hypothetical protein